VRDALLARRLRKAIAHVRQRAPEAVEEIARLEKQLTILALVTSSEQHPFVHILANISKVVEAGMGTHPHNDWIRRPLEHHLQRAQRHLRLLRDGDQREDHLSHACCRLLMALSLRELG
jgi:hypothetical protein